MRSFILLFSAVLWACLAQPAAAAAVLVTAAYPQIGTPVQLGATTAAAAATTLVLTTTANSPTGNLIVVVASSPQTSANNVVSVADSAGDTYVATTEINNASGADARLFYSANSASLPSGGTITVTFASATASHLTAAISVSGMASASPLDAQGAGTISAGGTTPSVSSGTLSKAPELVVGFVHISTGSGNTFTEASGFTANTPADRGAGGSILRWAYQIAPTTTSVTYAPVLGTAQVYGGNVITFKSQ